MEMDLEASSSQCFCDDGLHPYTGLDTTDCYDQNAEVHPLQENFFTEERGDDSFDYDCSESEELEWEGEGNGCDTGILTAFGLQCQANGVGWQDGQKNVEKVDFGFKSVHQRFLSSVSHCVSLQEI